MSWQADESRAAQAHDRHEEHERAERRLAAQPDPVTAWCPDCQRVERVVEERCCTGRDCPCAGATIPCCAACGEEVDPFLDRDPHMPQGDEIELDEEDEL